MCGIAGILDLSSGEAVSRGAVERMCDAIRHRGPDDFGAFVEGGVGLGMRRLSIIDVATGQQPIANEDESAWIVFNGEIYNHARLRDDLERAGHRFRTRSDTEAILHLYEEHGTDCLRLLRGMFAFAIWDRRRQTLFVARDRLGIKPLFWTVTGGRLLFASEIKALLTVPGVPREFDWNGFDSFFTYGYIPAPLTIYGAIAKLKPAHYLLVRNGQVTTHEYWDLAFRPKHRGSARDIREEFLARFGDAVGMRLMSEVPLGAFLSGGLDSGMIVAMMSRASADPVHTFCIGFGGDKGDFLDERPFAREIADRYGCDHHEIEVQPAVEIALDAGADSFDEPFADDSVIPTYHVCLAAKGQVTVVLTGLGGDEDFAGYERYLGFWYSRYYDLLPRPLREGVLRPLVRRFREEAGGHYRINHLKRFVDAGGLDPARRYQSYLRILDPDGRRRLYSPEVAARIDFDHVERLGREHFERLAEGDLLDRAIYQDLKMYLPDDILALSDRVGMHHSLELRVPFIDHEVVEFCARIPSALKIRGFEKKHLLKKAARAFLPPSVLNHRKQGFAAPMARWLRGDLKPLVARELSPAVLARDGLFRPETVGALVADHEARRSLNDKSIFALLVFNKWLAKSRLAA